MFCNILRSNILYILLFNHIYQLKMRLVINHFPNEKKIITYSNEYCKY